MYTKFAVRKSNSFGCFLWISSIVIAFVAIGLPLLTVESTSISEWIISISITIVVGGLFLWIWYDTNYIIDNDLLIAKSGPMVWKIPINEISLIRLNQKTFGGTWKPTLAWNCIEIKYKKYRSIYISPERQNVFVSQLMELNKTIVIKEK